MRVKKLVVMGVLIGVLAITLVASPALSAKKFITIASGPVGGEWYILGGILGEIVKEIAPGSKVMVRTGGSLSNLSTVNMGKADIGITQDRLFYEARNGIGAFKGRKLFKNVEGLCYLADIYMGVFLVRADFPINSIDEIKEKKIAIRLVTAPKASSPSKATERVLEAYGIKPEDLKAWGGSISYVSYSEASSLIKDGHADAYCGPILPAIVELSTVRKLKLLPLKKSVIDYLVKKYKYGRAVIPKGAYYFVKQDTETITESPIIIVNKKLSEDFVYKLTKAICTQPDRIRRSGKTYRNFDPEKAPNIHGGPIHPGALRYYKECGWIK